MQSFMSTTAGLKAILTLLILGGAIFSFVRERIPPDVTALVALLALLVTGVLTPAEAFSGFSHPATVSVAAVLVLSAGVERTGVLSFMARRILAPFARSELLFTAVMMLVIAALSAFINNTAAVAMFIPVVLDACRRFGLSPGRILMPMSHAATFGGLCTLIGTSTNLVAHEFARSQGLPGFSMFELARVGLPMLLVGSCYILLVGRWILPKSAAGTEDDRLHDDRYVTQIIVRQDSRWRGRPVRKEVVARDLDVELLDVERNGRSVALGDPDTRYSTGDILRVRGRIQPLLRLIRDRGFDVHQLDPGMPLAGESGPGSSKLTPDSGRLSLAEVVVLSTSGMIGQTLRGARFLERFSVELIGLRRRGRVTNHPADTPLHVGDVLLVEGTREALQELAATHGFLTIGSPSQPDARPARLAVSLLTLASVVVLASLQLLPIVTAASTGCAILILTGCLRTQEAYRAIDLSIVFLLAGSLALGLALEKTGVTAQLAHVLSGATGGVGPYAVLIGFFLVAVLISELMSNSGTVALLAPIAISTASAMHINPTSLLVAVAFGSSAAFAMPIGYQTSLMIYAPGGYRFRDFLRMGLVLDAILAIIAIWLIPRHWPLTAH